MSPRSKKIIFAGTDVFAVPCLATLVANFSKNVLAVISQPDKPAGRTHQPTSPPVAIFARDHNLPLHQPTDRAALTQVIHELQPDLVVVVAYGRLIPPELLASVPHGWLNVHPSLLPRHRGPTPIENAIWHGDQATGVSFMIIDAAMDHGPILEQQKISLTGAETGFSLSAQLGQLAAEHLPRVVAEYLAGKRKAQPQNHAQATTVTLLTREHGRIDCVHETATEIDRKVRAFDPWPGTFVILAGGERLKIFHGEIIANRASTSTGGFQCTVAGPEFICYDGSVYRALKVQREGKKPTTGQAFCTGYRAA